MEKLHEIWLAETSGTDYYSPLEKLGEVMAESFVEACLKFKKQNPKLGIEEFYNEKIGYFNFYISYAGYLYPSKEIAEKFNSGDNTQLT